MIDWALLGYCLISMLFLGSLGLILGFLGVDGGALWPAVTGFFAGPPFGVWLYGRGRRWLVMSAIIILLGVIWRLGGVVALLLTSLTIALTLFVSAATLRELYGGNEWRATRDHLKMMVRRYRGFQIVEQGKTVLPSNGGNPVLGPVLLIVRPNNVVVLVHGSKISRVCGPCMRVTRPFEYVAHIFDLCPQDIQVQVKDAYTADQIPVELWFSAIAGIQASDQLREDAGDVDTGILPVNLYHQQQLLYEELNALKALYLKWPNWQERLESLLQEAAHEAVHELMLEELLGSGGYQHLAEEIRTKAQALIPHGLPLAVEQVTIREMTIQKIYWEALARQWRGERQQDLSIKQGSVAARNLSDLLKAYRSALPDAQGGEEMARLILLQNLLESMLATDQEVLSHNPGLLSLIEDLIRQIRSLR